MRVKLSEIIEGLNKDDDFRKLAEDAGVSPAAVAGGGAGAGGGNTTTETPDSEMVGDTVEDEKEKIQTKLMELAGLQSESISAAKTEETLNTAQKAPAGEAAQPAGTAVNPGASAEADEVAEVVASTLGGMKPDLRKTASIKIVEKIAQMGALAVDDLKDVKVASARADEYDAAGRLMARAYHDEHQKIATGMAAKMAADDTAGEGAEEAGDDAADSEADNDTGLTSDELEFVESLES